MNAALERFLDFWRQNADHVQLLLISGVILAVLGLFALVGHWVIGRRWRERDEARRAWQQIWRFSLLLIALIILTALWASQIPTSLLAENIGVSESIFLRIDQTIITIAILWVAHQLALRIVRQRIHDIRQHYYWRRSLSYIFGIVGLLLIGRIWFTGLQNLGTFLGLLSAGIAIALQDTLANLAGWVFLVTRRPYQVGDRIQIGQTIGDVIDIQLFQTYLLECGNWVDADQSTGRTVLVPNSHIFKHGAANYTRGFEHIWDEVPVLVTFESDWRKAKQILSQIANEHAESLSTGAQEQIRRAARKHMIFFRNLTPIVYTDVKDSGVMLTIRYLTPPRSRRSNKGRIWEAILEAFADDPSIDFAYPSVRHYLNYIEGKPQAKAPIPGQPVALVDPRDPQTETEADAGQGGVDDHAPDGDSEARPDGR